MDAPKVAAPAHAHPSTGCPRCALTRYVRVVRAIDVHRVPDFAKTVRRQQQRDAHERRTRVSLLTIGTCCAPFVTFRADDRTRTSRDVCVAVARGRFPRA